MLLAIARTQDLLNDTDAAAASYKKVRRAASVGIRLRGRVRRVPFLEARPPRVWQQSQRRLSSLSGDSGEGAVLVAGARPK